MRRSLVAILSCSVLATVFATTSYLAALRNAPTVDEPICAVAGYRHVVDGDLRFDVDNPPLWKYWAMLPQMGHRLEPAAAPVLSSGEAAPAVVPREQEFVYSTRRLFQTAGNDGIAFVNRSRFAMVLVGVALAVCVAMWSWQLGGAVAAVVAMALFCLDANFLAHAPLIKADVAVALVLLAIAWATWRAGRCLSAGNVLAIGLLCGAALTVKFNAIIGPLLAAGLLGVRAVMAGPWRVGRLELETRLGRLAAAGAATLAAAVIAWVVVWAVYQFRFEPMSSGSGTLELAEQVEQLRAARIEMLGRAGGAAANAADPPADPLLVRTAVWLDGHRVFPRAWLYGLVSIYRSSTTIARQSYLMGEISTTGWWYYFPLAMLFKTPMVTLAMVLGSFIAAAVVRRCRERPVAGDMLVDRWTGLCLFVPAGVYMLAAMTSNANAGVRHVLPVYPPLYVFAGVVAARVTQLRPRSAKVAGAVLCAGLALEVALAFPWYISFFNAPSRPRAVFLLGDSNLDWGQGLTAVSGWRKQNPNVPLYLGYWGPADPTLYGIEYTPLPGGFSMGRTVSRRGAPEPGSAILVSVTLLQGVNVPGDIREYYRFLRERAPREVLAESVFVYEWE